MPEVPWHTVAGDFYGPMADGNYFVRKHMRTLAMGLTSTRYEEPMKSTPKKSSEGSSTHSGRASRRQVRQRLTISVAQVQRVCEEMGGLQTQTSDAPNGRGLTGKRSPSLKKLGKVLRATSNISGQHKEQARSTSSYGPTERRHHTPRQESRPITSCSELRHP
jgi:hypothetical protein